MPVLYVYEAPEASLQLYDKINAEIQEPPEGSLFHMACERDGGGLFVVEGWEDEEAQQRWNRKLQEKISSAGGPRRPEPRKYRIHNMRFGNEADVRG